VAASMAAFTRPDPTDRAAFEAHYQRVRTDPENTTRAIDEGGALVGMIASAPPRENRGQLLFSSSASITRMPLGPRT
jgi:hypothetical protein